VYHRLGSIYLEWNERTKNVVVFIDEGDVFSTNQRWLVLTSPSSINTTTFFVLSSHASVVLDKSWTKTFEYIKQPFSRILKNLLKLWGS